MASTIRYFLLAQSATGVTGIKQTKIPTHVQHQRYNCNVTVFNEIKAKNKQEGHNCTPEFLVLESLLYSRMESFVN